MDCLHILLKAKSGETFCIEINDDGDGLHLVEAVELVTPGAGDCGPVYEYRTVPRERLYSHVYSTHN